MKLKIAMVATLVVASIALLGGTFAAGRSYMSGALNEDQVSLSGCVIRFSNSDGTPSIHANESHQCAGVERVYINSKGYLEVKQTPSNGRSIMSASISPDETLTARGIIAGASGGVGTTKYNFYDTRLKKRLDLNKKEDRMRLQGRYSNAWLSWTHGYPQ